jgi:hypothetical protein
MTLNEYKWNVYQLAKAKGYSDSEIEAFTFDIEDAYEDGLSVEECLDKEF